MGGLTGSLSASGSHMERMGAMRDNLSETASTTALAGASITGSLSGSAMVNCYNRSGERSSAAINTVLCVCVCERERERERESIVLCLVVSDFY